MLTVKERFKDFYVNPWLLRFADKALDREYVLYSNARITKMISLSTGMGVITWTIWQLINYIFYPAIYNQTYKFMFLFVVPMHFFITVILFHLGGTYRLQLINTAINIFSGSCICLFFAQLPEDYTLKFGYGIILIINVFCFTTTRMHFFYAVFSSSFVFIAYFLMLLFYKDYSVESIFFTFGICSFINLLGWISAWFFERFSRQEFLAAKLIQKQKEEINVEKEKSDELVSNMLPAQTAARLLSGEKTIADRYNNVSILFADLTGFTILAQKIEPEKLVQLLNRIFTDFDSASKSFGLEKIKTIGDAYMAAAGMPIKHRYHAISCVKAAEEMLKIIEKVNHDLTEPLKLRIGIATGPAVAGVIGQDKFSYDVWGDTVNEASRMESHGIPGKIHISKRTKEELNDEFSVTSRGEISIKGYGNMQTYLVDL